MLTELQNRSGVRGIQGILLFICIGSKIYVYCVCVCVISRLPLRHGQMFLSLQHLNDIRDLQSRT